MIELVIRLGDRVIQEYRGDQELVNIGRDPGCDIVLDNLGVSRQHAQIRKVAERYVLADNQSTNGTILNGRRITSHELQSGDSFEIGKFTIKFALEQEEQRESGLEIDQTIAMPSLAAPQVDEAAGEAFVASITRPVFHRKDCLWIKATPVKQKVFFASAQEAVQSGRRPCKSCNPTVATPQPTYPSSV